MLTIYERYDIFKKTISLCGCYLLNETDEMISYYLFDVFAIDVFSFLHDNTLKLLKDEGLIDELIENKCKTLRMLYLEIEQNRPDLLSANAVRNSSEWETILKLSDEIINILYI